ncbi:MAG TPA: hypothetical protein VEB65_02580 [Solirubrobacterales bacterium]|nr:hypothetical protein [Solirubrobacterales bacterium]
MDLPRRLGALAGRVGGTYAGIARIYRDWWGAILLLGIVVFVPLGLIDAAANQIDVESLNLDSGIKVFALVTAAGLVTTTGLLGEVFFAGAISLSLTHPEGDRPPPLSHLARRIKYWRLIRLDIAYVVIVAVGLILLVVPGVAAFVLLGLSGPAVELEHRTVRGALARSYRLVRSDFWLVFWVLVPIEIAGDVLGDVAERQAHHLLGESFFSTWLSESVTNILLSPVFAIAAVLLATRLIAALEGSGPRIRSLGVRQGEELGAPA